MVILWLSLWRHSSGYSQALIFLAKIGHLQPAQRMMSLQLSKQLIEQTQLWSLIPEIYHLLCSEGCTYELQTSWIFHLSSQLVPEKYVFPISFNAWRKLSAIDKKQEILVSKNEISLHSNLVSSVLALFWLN